MEEKFAVQHLAMTLRISRTLPGDAQMIPNSAMSLPSLGARKRLKEILAREEEALINSHLLYTLSSLESLNDEEIPPLLITPSKRNRPPMAGGRLGHMHEDDLYERLMGRSDMIELESEAKLERQAMLEREAMLGPEPLEHEEGINRENLQREMGTERRHVATELESALPDQAQLRLPAAYSAATPSIPAGNFLQNDGRYLKYRYLAACACVAVAAALFPISLFQVNKYNYEISNSVDVPSAPPAVPCSAKPAPPGVSPMSLSASEREIAGKAAADAAFEKAREVTTLDDEGNGPSAFGPLGLVQWSWAKAGVVVPCSREAQLQYPAVEESDVRPGDIVMLYQLDLAYAVPTIYYGNGKVVAIITGVGVRIYDLDKLRLWLDVNISIHRPG